MLKSTIEFVNRSASDADYKGQGVAILVPGLETVSAIVDYDVAADIIADFTTQYPAIATEVTGTEDDGIDPPYQPYIKNNFEGAAPPAVMDDEVDGYAPGSLWIDTEADPMEVYRCTDATEGAAVWIKTTLSTDELGSLALEDADGLDADVNLTSTHVFKIDDVQVVGAPVANIATEEVALAGTATQKTGYGFVSDTEMGTFITGVNALRTKLNSVMALLEAHGLMSAVT